MSLSRETMMKVMSYVDGELEGEARDKVEALLAMDDEASQLALELRTLGECVRVVHGDRKLEKDPGEIADDVMRELDKRLAPIGSLAERRRNAAITAVITGAMAIAAGWFLLATTPNHSDVSAQANPTQAVTPPPPTQATVSAAPEQLAAQTPAPEGVDVESVESPSHEVSVFYVPAMASASSNGSSVVVWIQEGEAKK